MKKGLKIISWTLASLFTIVFLIAIGGYIYLNNSIKISEKKNILATQLYTWNKISMDQPAVCSDGSEYSIFSRRGNSQHLIIYFAGGGACWDDTTCTQPFSIFEKGYYSPNIQPKMLAYSVTGIAEIDNEENPFKDWNIAYIPYCSGDFHIGNIVNQYQNINGQKEKVSHKGQSNIIAAFNWIFTNFHNADKILIAGESAGGFGNIFWTLAIAKNYPKIPIYQLSDCSWGDSREWPEVVDKWNAKTERIFGYPVNEDIFGSALLNTAQSLKDKNITFLQSNSTYDRVLTDYYWQLNDLNPKTTDYKSLWSQNMRQAMKSYDDSLNNYYYFLTDWNKNDHGITPHTFLSNKDFHQCEEEGILFKDWLAKTVIEDKPFSVGEKLLIKE